MRVPDATWGRRRTRPVALQEVPVPTRGRHALWGRQRGESAKAYQAFTVYLAMWPPERRVRDVARTLGRSFSLMARWSRRWRWRVRARALDLDRLRFLPVSVRSLTVQRDLAELSGQDASQFRTEIASAQAEARRLVCGRCPFAPLR